MGRHDEAGKESTDEQADAWLALERQGESTPRPRVDSEETGAEIAEASERSWNSRF